MYPGPAWELLDSFLLCNRCATRVLVLSISVAYSDRWLRHHSRYALRLCAMPIKTPDPIPCCSRPCIQRLRIELWREPGYPLGVTLAFEPGQWLYSLLVTHAQLS